MSDKARLDEYTPNDSGAEALSSEALSSEALGPDTLKLESQLCHRFYTLSNAFTRAYRPLLKSLDITYPQYVVMMALWEQSNVTIAELLDKTVIDGGAMTLILKKLEQKELLSVVKDEHDKRVRRVVLSKAGENAKLKALDVPAQMLCKLDGMSKTEAKQLVVLMDKLQGCFNVD
ncbi:MarR family winged helix-turn-helix transcriptional regulator [Alteromonas naphthalenivorans]|uniref:OhrR transcriptional regulator, MarR/EmrR family protein n=1 Tax=Alteromonas naphthalenivorans TaxID=715451 RepID=F5ZEI0_ALTNA|nr:MarR family winged helix-turn-helix transcriptional regulator [Alteromonas naphthalenivorans]AEF04371.1 putative OhrR transcriptional regulator, MarR/EmrR family protein [Alteromonas naphthalenivorans]